MGEKSKCGVIPLRFLETFRELSISKEDYVCATQSVFEYMLTGEFNEEALTCSVCLRIIIRNMIHDLQVIREHQEQKSLKLRENGKLGGRPPKSQENQKVIFALEKKASDNQTESKKKHVYVDVYVDGNVNGEEDKEKGITPTLQKSVEESRVSVDEDAKIVLEYLNEKAGKKFTPVESNTRYIAARLKEKDVTVDKCKQIIDDRVFEWKGKVNGNFEGDKYLTPQTIFCKTNFWKYEGMLTDNEKKPNYYMRKHSLTEDFGF